MSVQIEYNSSLTIKNKNIVIFVSNLSQLKNINLPINLDVYLKDKEFCNQLINTKRVNINHIYCGLNFFLNVVIFLINSSINDQIYIGSSILNYCNKSKINNINFIFSKKLSNNNKNILTDIIFGFCLRSYQFNKYQTTTIKSSNQIVLNLINLNNFKKLNYKLNLLSSINFSKNLVSEPANILNPIYYANKCLELKKIGLKVKVLNFHQLEKIGMRSLLGVARGSDNEPRVVILEWNLKNNTKPTVLVGKGVTFDTGGISLKPSTGMEEMITDMGGSAVVVGSLMNAALNKSSKSIIGIIGLVENMPDGKAQRPGDIIKSLSGQTIEILNTDAEGRLVLADIITYIQKKYKPKLIIDFATLTGAIMIALGTHRAGLFSNNDNLSKKLEIAGEITGEKLWRLPLGKEYDSEINTSRADMKNIGSTRFGGSIQAAQFIQRFITKNLPWAHIDIAGVSWTMKANLNTFSKLHSPGATAFGVRLIDQFLKGK